MNILARGMRALMRGTGSQGYFCVGREDAYFLWNGLRFRYHFEQFGVCGNIDSGGSTETETIAKLCEILEDGGVFYDIGAHEGLYALTLKHRMRNYTIYAFEPNANGLRTNLNLNDANDVLVFECAVGDRDTTVPMTTDRRSSNFVLLDGRRGTKVKMHTLDTLITNHKLKRPVVMKLDIEGFEFQALRGAIETLGASRPIIITEINDCFYRYHGDLGPWRIFMKRLGYDLYTLEARVFARVPDNILSVDHLPQSADANYWWLQPHQL